MQLWMKGGYCATAQKLLARDRWEMKVVLSRVQGELSSPGK